MRLGEKTQNNFLIEHWAKPSGKLRQNRFDTLRGGLEVNMGLKMFCAIIKKGLNKILIYRLYYSFQVFEKRNKT